MRNLALWLYFGLYASLNMSDFADPDTRGGPVAITINVVLFIVASVGLIAFITRADMPRMSLAWKVVAPLIVAGYAVSFAISPFPVDPSLTPAENDNIRVFSILFGCLLLAPVVLVNFAVAMRSHVRDEPPSA